MKNFHKTKYIVVLAGLLLPVASFAAPIAAVPDSVTELRVRAVSDVLMEKQTSSQILPTVERAPEEIQKVRFDKRKHRETIAAFEEARRNFLNNPNLFENRKTMLVRTLEGLENHAERTRLQTMRFPVITESLYVAITEVIDTDVAELDRLKQDALKATNREELSLVSAEARAHRAAVTEQNLRGLMVLAHIEVVERQGIQKLQEYSGVLEKRIKRTSTDEVATSTVLLKNLSGILTEQTARTSALKQFVSEKPVTLEALTKARGELSILREGTLKGYAATRELITEVQKEE